MNSVMVKRVGDIGDATYVSTYMVPSLGRVPFHGMVPQGGWNAIMTIPTGVELQGSTI